MNHALDVDAREWIAPLDDDDEFAADHVEAMLNACRTNEWEWCFASRACSCSPATARRRDLAAAPRPRLPFGGVLLGRPAIHAPRRTA